MIWLLRLESNQRPEPYRDPALPPELRSIRLRQGFGGQASASSLPYELTCQPKPKGEGWCGRQESNLQRARSERAVSTVSTTAAILSSFATASEDILRSASARSRMAEGVGFEPTEPRGPPVFGTGAISRSATSPSVVGADGLEPPHAGCRPAALPLSYAP
jgi:hypothetical protein